MQASVVTAHGPVVAAPGARAQAQKLCHMRLVAPRHEGSSWVRGQTPVSCISRQILYHWATREAPNTFFWGTRISCSKYGHVQKSRSYGWWLKGPKTYTLQKRREGEIETRETPSDDWGASCLVEEGEDLLHPISSPFFSSGGTTGTDGEEVTGK